jgi:hypothetical protein
MFALVGLVGNLGGGAVVVHRLGRRHIGVRPFETKRDRGQIEEYQKLLGKCQAEAISNSKVHGKKTKVPLVEKKRR